MLRVIAAALLALAASADLSAVARSAKVDVTDRQTKVLALPDGKPLVIEITIGTVRIEGWDRPDAEITVERRAPSSSQFARLPVSNGSGSAPKLN